MNQQVSILGFSAISFLGTKYRSVCGGGVTMPGAFRAGPEGRETKQTQADVQPQNDADLKELLDEAVFHIRL